MSWIDVAFLLNNLTESPLTQVQTTTVTNYSPIIILVTLMKEKKWYIWSSAQVTHNKTAWWMTPATVSLWAHKDSKSFSNPGLTKVPEASYCMDAVWYWIIQQKQQHGVSFPELQLILKILYPKQSHSCTQSALLTPENLLRLWSRCSPTPMTSTKKRWWMHFLSAI